MKKNLNASELIESPFFIREPVDQIRKQIINNASKKIILNGERGSGKSVILYNMQNRGIGTENQTVFIKFDLSRNTYQNNFLNHYYELELSFQLLSYIKKNYLLTYEKYFKDMEILLQDIAKDTKNYLSNYLYEKTVTLNRFLVPGEISLEIQRRMKEYLDINTITFAIDRFDWLSNLDQKNVSNYFDIFDKTIITTDDEDLKKEEYRKSLKNKGYALITTDYASNKEVVKEIIKERMKFNYENLDVSMITDEIYDNLMASSAGNISFMLDTCKSVAEVIDFSDGLVEDIKSEFDYEIKYQQNQLKKLRTMNENPPKFCL